MGSRELRLPISTSIMVTGALQQDYVKSGRLARLNYGTATRGKT